MANLPTNLKDDILDSSVNTRRKYRMIENADGTVEFEDMTEYSQMGDEYGAGLINETNRQVNEKVEKAVVVKDLDTINAITQEGYVPDALALKEVNESLASGEISFSVVDGEPYVKVGADTPRPFSGSLELVSNNEDLKTHSTGATLTATVNYTHTCTRSGSVVVILHGANESPNYETRTESVKINGVEQNKDIEYTGYRADFADVFLLDCKKGDVVDLTLTLSRQNTTYMKSSYALYA